MQLRYIFTFILFSLIPTFHLLPEYYIYFIGNISHYLLVISMVGVGLKITFNDFFTYGKAAFIVGSLTFIIQVILTSIGIISLL